MKPFGSRSNLAVVVTLVFCIGATLAAPSVRVKRDEETLAVAESGANPIASEDLSLSNDLDRDKRKVPSDPKWEAKNAILGFVFGKINSLIDAKTRFVDKLDQANIEKNKQYHIESPKPITSFQTLVSSVITPKVQFITGKIGSLSGSLLGGSSGGSSGGSDEHGNGSPAAPGLGGVVSSLLKLSGPILSGSSGGGNGGSNSVSLGDHDDDDEASKQANQALKDAINPTRPPVTSTTDDTPDFDRQKVSLQVPDALFGSSFSLVTNISTRVGNLIMNTARRTGEFLWVLQPLVGNNLSIEIPTTTTTTTTPRTTTTTTRATTTTTTTTTSNSVQTNEIK
ncbi:uncharacterized protein LOC129760766 [Uranotaenia lowii]|uniref:uncharacterized protein LOC129760766 n=1 Tax=Uranotaenia lowii TaxID=190385 RepID=UPI00247B249B|nr:uncharacterized protein LOC129760766 [Uranotaenia lowii]